MKRQIVTSLLPLSLAAMMAGAQSTPDKTPSQVPQTHEYWVDPDTKLMWAAKDNGKDVSWKGAIKYCRNLNLAGYNGWRMANLGELQGLYNESATSPGMAGDKQHYRSFTWRVSKATSS